MYLRVVLLPWNVIPYTLNPREDLPLGCARAFAPWEELYQSRLAHGCGERSAGTEHRFLPLKPRCKSRTETVFSVKPCQHNKSISKNFKLKKNPKQDCILVLSLLLIKPKQNQINEPTNKEKQTKTQTKQSCPPPSKKNKPKKNKTKQTEPKPNKQTLKPQKS